MTQTADVVICGAGIAGIAAAYSLAVTHGVRHVVLVDERPPMTLTSDKSTEAYRNWWPGPDDAMVRFMNHSIDLIESLAEASDNRFLLNRRGYLYTTADPARAAQFQADAALAAAQGAGDVRVYRDRAQATHYQPSAHTGYRNHPSGADLFLDRGAIREHFGFLSDDIVAVMHARRCGWFSGQQFGMHLLEQAKAAGVTFVDGRVESVQVEQNRVRSVGVVVDGRREVIHTDVFVNSAGPFAREVSRLVGVELPLFSELHLKVAFEDVLGVVDRNTGLVILDDVQSLPWPDDVRSELAADEETRWLTEPLPAGIHLRPEGYHGSRTVLMLWDYHSLQQYAEAMLPVPDDPLYPEVALRGLVQLVPGLSAYLDAIPHSWVDGGYYTKTIENRPLIGPLAVDGAFVNAAFSGFGLMAAPAAGELLAAYITAGTLPAYAPAFSLRRYDDPAYQQQLANWGSTGQL